MFLSTLQEKVERKIQIFGDFIDVRAFHRVKNLYEFDEVYTAPIHGFKNGMDYWTRCSAKYVLPDVRVPLLLLNPLNDPFQPIWRCRRKAIYRTLCSWSSPLRAVISASPRESGPVRLTGCRVIFCISLTLLKALRH